MKQDWPRIWTWMHPHRNESDRGLKHQLERLKSVGVEGILFLAYDGREAFFESSTLPTAGDELGRVLQLARPLGLEVHAWIFTLNCNAEAIRREHPEWFVVNRKGNSTLAERPYVDYYNWLCPSREDVIDYLLHIIRDLGKIAGLKGIHLDYIRFPDVILPKGLRATYNLVQDRELPEYDYCYCEVCRKAFREVSGVDPLDLDDPSASAEWRAFREKQISRLVRRAVDEIHNCGKLATAAVFATPNLARQLVRQDWARWPLDAVFPMIYHKFYDESIEWIGTASREGRKALPDSIPLFAGVFVPELPGDDTGRALECALGGGAAGVSLFSAEELTQDRLASLARVKERWLAGQD